jgi:hypothetical protein
VLLGRNRIKGSKKDQSSRERKISATQRHGDLKAGHVARLFYLPRSVPYARHRESVGTAPFEVNHLDQPLTVVRQTVMFFKRRMVIIGITAAHDQGLLLPTTVRGRCIARSRRRIPSRRSAMVAGCMVPMRLSPVAGLTDAVDSVRGKGDYARHLLDFKLLTGPPQTFAERSHGGHDGSARTPRIARPAPAAALTAIAATRSARGSGALSGGSVELRLDQTLRIVAIRRIEIPAAAEIDAGRWRLLEFLARASGEGHDCQHDDEPHTAILY